MQNLDAKSRGAAIVRTERQAADILRDFGIVRPPTPDNIVSHLGNVVVQYEDWKNLSGACTCVDGKWILAVNKNDPRPRRRFTLMHEFKHALDGVSARDYFAKREGPARTFEEFLADHFAVHILMPENWVRNYYPKLKRVDTMAWRFGVSFQAMKVRLRELGLRSAAS